MTTRIREMEVLTEVKELRLKVMELETQVRGWTAVYENALAAVSNLVLRLTRGSESRAIPNFGLVICFTK